MLKLNDGRNELWQWDTGRKLTVDAECSEVHFSNKVYGRSIDVAVIDGTAAIPDILLQVDKELYAWGFVGTPENGYTKISKVFRVNRRNKPEDYVFTPPEQTTLAGIMEELNKLKEVVSPEKIGEAVNEYLEENPVTPNKIGAVAQNQGEENADKILGIDAAGEVVPVDKPSGGSENAVTYTKQELTAEEQTQARENIGAEQESIIVEITGNDTNGYSTTMQSSGIQNYLAHGRNVVVVFNVAIGGTGISGKSTTIWDASQGDESRTKVKLLNKSYKKGDVIAEVYEGMYGTGVRVYFDYEIASENTYGKIKADPAESTDTVPARIGDDGKLYVDALPSSTLQSTINTALEQAKASGEFNGEDGTSVTITNTTESTEDGGENVVEFSDGNKLTVRNGKTGAQGDPGVYVGSEDTMPEGTIVRIDPDGEAMELVEVDDTLKLQGYAADAKVTGEKLDELSEAIADQQEQIDGKQPKGNYVKTVNGVAPDVAGNVQVQVQAEQIPFVDSIDEMTDTSKVYCLTTDGFIYKYGTKTEIIVHEAENRFVPSEATINQRMGSSSLSEQNGFVWTGAIPVDLTKESPFRIKVEGTKITENTSTYQKIWLCADNTGTTKLSAAVLLVGNNSSNYAPLSADGIIHADYKGGAKLSDSIISQTKYLRIGFKFSDSAIGSTAELSGVSITFLHEAYTEEKTVTGWFSTGISGISNDLEPRVAALEEDVLELKNSGVSGSDEISVPSFWGTAVNNCIAKIKALQSGRECVTFAFFSDNHQNTKYLGSLIGKVMQECNIPFCLFGGDAIDSGTLANEAAMIANDKAFDDAVSIIPVAQMCRAVGNHDGYWLDEDGVQNRYTRSQIYDLFLRQESIAQNKHYGGDGTYYYVDDLSSGVRFVVCNMNYNINTATNTLDSVQINWLTDVIFADENKSRPLVFISHQPITNNHHSNIYADTAHAIQELLGTKIDSGGFTVIGWFSGHIHADRIYQVDHTNNTEANDQTTVSLPWKTVTIRADHTGLCRDEDLKHEPADDDQSHAIDFVTINKATRTVNLTRLGIGEDRSYTY